MFGALGFLGNVQEAVDTPTYNYDGSSAGTVHQTVTYYDYTPPTPETPSTPTTPPSIPSTPSDVPVTVTPRIAVDGGVFIPTTNRIQTTANRPGGFLDAILGLFSPEQKDANGNLINTGNVDANGNPVAPGTPGSQPDLNYIYWMKTWSAVQNFASDHKTALIGIGAVAGLLYITKD